MANLGVGRSGTTSPITRTGLTFTGDPRLLARRRRTPALDFADAWPTTTSATVVATGHASTRIKSPRRRWASPTRERALDLAAAAAARLPLSRRALASPSYRLQPRSAATSPPHDDRAGMLLLATPATRRRRSAKAAVLQADLVIVFPHWGRRVQRTNADERPCAALVGEPGWLPAPTSCIGSHPHWAGGDRRHRWQPSIFYCAGQPPLRPGRGPRTRCRA